MDSDKEMTSAVIDGNDQVTGHIISTTIGGKNGEPKQTISYMAERVVGTGSFGIVFQAKCLETGETVAIKKVLQDRRYKNRELQLMRLMDHPNVVSLKHCFFSTTTNELFLNLVMEYVPETMYRVLNANQRMPLIYVKLYTYQIFRGLAYIHAVPGVCHRDVKPQNLLVDPLTHQVKLCDFGSAKVLGCDGSILLDDTATFKGEKNAFPNQNSARGFEVIDTIKTRVEAACNHTVSCADILAIAARDGVVLLGGPSWPVALGRRDATTASQAAANAQIPSPFSALSTLISMFAAKGLSARDMTALSGGHTIGFARCATFRARIYNETNIDPAFAASRRSTCPAASGSGDANLAPLDVQSPNRFGNNYYQDLVARRGLLHSDQELFSGGTQDSLVRVYSGNEAAFASDFAAAMVRMGSISPLTGVNGQIRRNCRVAN